MATVYAPNPNEMTPNAEPIDMDANQNFTAVMRTPLVDKYTFEIQRVSDNASLYLVSDVVVSPAITQGDTLTITVSGGSVANTTDDLKFILTVFNGVDSATSLPVVFFALDDPVVTLTVAGVITSQKLSLSATYSQTQGIDVESFTYNLYDTNDNLLDTSGVIEKSILDYEFTGLLNGTTYKVEVVGTTTRGQSFDSGLQTFSVSYSEPNFLVQPEAVVSNCDSSVTITWDDVIQILGTSTGSISYENNFAFTGDVALVMSSGSTVEWTVNIPQDFTATYIFQPQSGTDTFLGEFTGGSHDYFFGYEDSRFFIEVDGSRKESEPFILSASKAYLMVLYNDDFIVSEFNI